jgi:hypothetical protein
MSLNEIFYYYGRVNGIVPQRTFSDDLLTERKRLMFQELKEMEDRIKRHITECKREIVKELISMNPNPPTEEIKEQKKYGRKIK